jgi:glycosyltransferase involved in cell wall biosynthesis
MKKILLSVIVPTRNRANMLKRALESITKQNLSQECFETIVVDNGSTDETREVVDSFVEKIPNLRYLYEETPGLHVGRHKGLKEAKADILVYADDDIEAFPTWLEGIAKAFEDKDVALVGGKNLPKFESDPPAWIKQMWETNRKGYKKVGALSILDLGNNVEKISPLLVYGCNYSIRKSVLIEAGGFHPDGMPQELIRYRGDGETHVSMYIQNKGYKAIYTPKASIYHIVPSKRMTEDYFCTRAFNQGISDSFSQIRARYLQTFQHEHNVRQMITSVKKIMRWPAVKLLTMIKQFHINDSSCDKEIQEKIKAAYQAGWLYHQELFKNDASIAEHVLQRNYIE